ncbi:WD repeat-containing protein 76 [Lingula anatina]|uniref:WD repeat-containing protein 76 n=1 Tax=Lingula anatina TaxID=7574 RepID=A0A1S3HXN3_LINAN|nr:WD repeat-containing protein 76 [Lingula anatina]|eukprot:XP_013390792.1 WD repeat-containing protein 76 [Lingula anatina]
MIGLRKRDRSLSNDGKSGSSAYSGKRLKVEDTRGNEAEHRSLKTQEIRTAEDTEILPGEEGLSEFERRRLKNLRDNAKFFEEMGIFKAKDAFRELSEKPKVKPTERGLKRGAVKPEPLPRRAPSLRLQNKDPAGEELPERPTIFVEPTEEHPRKASGPLTMCETLKNAEENTETSHNNFLSSLKTLGEGKEKKSVKVESSLENFLKACKRMKLHEDRVAKVVKDRIFSVAVHPSETRVFVCAGDKWGKIGLWDVESKEGDDGVFLYEPHSRPVNCMFFDPSNASRLYSCSYDGTIRRCDFNKAVFDELYATPEEDSNRCSGFDFLDASNLVVSHSDGDVGLVDIRTKGLAAEHMYQCHRKSVKTINVHPVKKHYFLTGSTDGNACIWDIRQMKDKKPVSVDTLPHGRNLSSAFFSPQTGKFIVTCCVDDRLRIFEGSTPGEYKQRCSTRHNNHTGRWLTPFRFMWHPSREDVIVTGSMDRPRRIELFDTSGHLIHTFTDGDYLGSVCSINAFHPTRNILVGANSSGRLHVFM